MTIYVLFDEEMHLLGAFRELGDARQTSVWWKDAGVKTLLWGADVEDVPLYPGWLVTFEPDGTLRRATADPLVQKEKAVERIMGGDVTNVLAPTRESAIREARVLWHRMKQDKEEEEEEKVSETD